MVSLAMYFGSLIAVHLCYIDLVFELCSESDYAQNEGIDLLLDALDDCKAKIITEHGAIVEPSKLKTQNLCQKHKKK